MTRWPALPLDAWQGTYDTLHMWMQVIGKVALKLTPRTNHFWNVAYHFNARGLQSQVIGAGLTATFDFTSHELLLACSDGGLRRIALEPMTVAHFYSRVMAELKALGIGVKIWTTPSEFANPIPFEPDTTHRSYDRESVECFWHILQLIRPVFEEFRCGFVGKCSPVHFWWGAFDLSVSRFSGRTAPPKPEMGSIYAEGYSHEVISHGWWPGSAPVLEPAFYAYIAPGAEGFSEARVEPSAAYWHKDLGEFILPYEAVRRAPNPEKELRAFMDSTYSAAADLAKWNRVELER